MLFKSAVSILYGSGVSDAADGLCPTVVLSGTAPDIVSWRWLPVVCSGQSEPASSIVRAAEEVLPK